MFIAIHYYCMVFYFLNPRRITKRKTKRRQQKDKSYKINILWDFFYYLLATLTATKRSLTDKK